MQQYMPKNPKSGIIVVALACFTLLNACSDRENEQAALQRSELSVAARDTAENTLVSTMEEINRNLERIREAQGLISMDTREKLSNKASILKNIHLINALIEDNKKKIEALTAQARKLGKENGALARIADLTRARISKQEEEIAALKEQLAQESFKVADLNQRMDEMLMKNEDLLAERTLLAESNAEMDRDLYKGYFTYGTFKQLSERNLVEKKGGILGIGKKETLNNAFTKNKALFTELDIREAQSIPVHGRKPRLVTTHPDGSYEWIEKEGEEYATLRIKNFNDFWSTSRFLVVEVR
jgi:hypothetical protein